MYCRMESYKESTKMTDDELKEYITKTVGSNYNNYPVCVEWNLKVLHYLENMPLKKLKDI